MSIQLDRTFQLVQEQIWHQDQNCAALLDQLGSRDLCHCMSKGELKRDGWLWVTHSFLQQYTYYSKHGHMA